MPINKIARKKRDDNNNNNAEGYQYNDSKYHPVEEYLSSEVERVTSDTPSFVLEVTWPRVALFYHPASPLCLQLRDAYVQRAREVRHRSLKIPVEFYAVSCQVHRDACEELGVLAVPRILGYPKGSIDGKLIPRTSNNNVRIDDIVDQLGISLQEEEEDEVDRKEMEFEKEQLEGVLVDGNLRGGGHNQDATTLDEDHLHSILHPHSKLKDVYRDAIASLLLSLDNNLEVGGYEWTSSKYHAFCEWIDLMHWTLPTRDMALVHNIVGDIRNNYDQIASDPKELIRILQSHGYYDNNNKNGDPTTSTTNTNTSWSPSCQSQNPHDHGFACGFWKLLHIMSIGVAEQHMHVMGDVHRVVVSHVQSVVHNYIQEFGFASSKAGTKVIVHAYKTCRESDQCKDEMGIVDDESRKGGLWNRAIFRRRPNLPEAEHPVWRSLGLWLWKAHQTYRNKRLQHHKDELPGVLGAEDLQWPPAALCPKCYASGVVDGTGGGGAADDDTVTNDDHHIQDETNTNIIWNKEQVYEHLKREYWPRTLQSPRVVVLDRYKQKRGEVLRHLGSTQQEILLHASALLAFVIVLAITYHRLQRRRSGRHKKHDRQMRMKKSSSTRNGGGGNSSGRSRNGHWNRRIRKQLSYDSSDDGGYSQYAHVDDSDDGDGAGAGLMDDADDRSYLGLSVASAVRRNPAPARRRTNHQASRIPLAFIDES